jgi:hypothetical protein
LHKGKGGEIIGIIRYIKGNKEPVDAETTI